MMRATETPEYWRQHFQVEEDDLSAIYEYLLETGVPHHIDELARHVMQHRQEREAKELEERGRTLGTVYQPKELYDVGQRLRFPALGDVVGEVVGVREGDNPEYGEFKVIQVMLQGEGRIREFASGFPLPHPLNEEEMRISLDDLYAMYGDYVRQALVVALEGHGDFVSFGPLWFLADLMPEVHIGHLNIAEAMIEIAGKPLSTEALLEEIELPEETPLEARLFALNYALIRDARFVNVGDDVAPLWNLAHPNPQEAVEQ